MPIWFDLLGITRWCMPLFGLGSSDELRGVREPCLWTHSEWCSMSSWLAALKDTECSQYEITWFLSSNTNSATIDRTIIGNRDSMHLTILQVSPSTNWFTSDIWDLITRISPWPHPLRILRVSALTSFTCPPYYMENSSACTPCESQT